MRFHRGTCTGKRVCGQSHGCERHDIFAGVVVDAAPGPIRPGSPTRHFLIFIPGGIRLEFATPFT